MTKRLQAAGTSFLLSRPEVVRVTSQQIIRFNSEHLHNRVGQANYSDFFKSSTNHTLTLRNCLLTQMAITQAFPAHRNIAF